MIMTYRDIGLLNNRIVISGILLDLQKSGKKIFVPTKYFELKYISCVVESMEVSSCIVEGLGKDRTSG